VDSLIHRGPDCQDVFESRFVSLGVARLTILDLDAGNQPMLDDTGNTVLVFNGEIYNHLELRRELENLGHRFHSRTDTETLLHAFLEWDTDCFARLRGMFALGVWIESCRRLVLARDRMGIKPLYLARRGSDVYFGSEMKTIFVHPEIERRLDLAGLDCYLSLNYVPAPWTLVEGIEKLRPGHFHEWKDGQVLRSEPYWMLPETRPCTQSYDEAEQQLDTLLDQAVKEHLLSDVPVGLWLSGGVDSSSILHYAARASGTAVKTFSISFEGRSFDESASIRKLVDHFGTDHQQLDLNTDLCLQDAIEEFAYFADEPNGDAGSLPIWFLSKMTRDSATVALSGEGADELFGGYVTYRANALARWARCLPASLLRLASGAIRLWPVSDEKISLEYKLKRFLEGCSMRPEQAHVYWNGTFSEDQKCLLVDRELPAALHANLRELSRGGDHTAAYLRHDQKYYLADDILAKVDRMSMAHSVEVRPPFLDHRIVEFAAGVPAKWKIQGSRQKILLRHLMRNKLPAEVLAHKKIGFDIPAHEWLRGPLRPLLQDTLEGLTSQEDGLFRSSEIRACLNDHFSRRANFGYHLWGLMILFLWMRKWRIQTGAIPELEHQPATANAISTY
jgi:asparagine synthase (glutamine-hydrolysing)